MPSAKHRYRITIEELVSEPKQTSNQLEFDLADREDLFKLVETLKQHSGLEVETATKVGVALRLLGPVMIEQRKHPLFIDFMPHFKAFMQHLKSTIKNAAQGF